MANTHTPTTNATGKIGSKQSAINLHNTDCLEALRTFKDNQFDLCIADPPYGLEEAGAYSHISATRKLYTDKMADWDKRPTQEYFDEVRRVSKNQIIFGLNYFMDMLPPSRCFIVWDNCNRGLSFSQAELAWASFPQMSKVVKINSSQPNRIHRCQKPVALYRWLLDTYAPKGSSILDTHLGSGSIALAVHGMDLHKYSLTAYEINKEYYENAVHRLQLYQDQLKLAF